MLIQNLSLKNFKCFEEVDVEFAPITLLTGANSSGKSSLIYSLLAVLQTEQFPFYLSPNGKYVNLGGFEEVISKKDKSKELNINIAFYDLYSRLGFVNKWRKDFLMKINTIWEEGQNDKPIYRKVELNDNNKIGYKASFEIVNKQLEVCFQLEEIEDFVTTGRILESLEKNNFQIELKGKQVLGKLTTDSIDSITNILPKSADWYYMWLFNLPKLSQFIDTSFNYIGSFRQPPERTYYQKAKAQSKVDTDGAGYIDQIIEWEETNPEKLAELAKIMSELELFQEIRSNKFKGGRFELAVKTQKNSEMAALTDVGFGISQFLPIIVADLQLDDHSCLALSQPEIHLHPKIQALVRKFFGQSGQAHPKAVHRRNPQRIFIESNSAVVGQGRA